MRIVRTVMNGMAGGLIAVLAAAAGGCDDALPPGPDAPGAGTHRLIFSSIADGGAWKDSMMIMISGPDGAGAAAIASGRILGHPGTNRFAFLRNDSLFVATWSAGVWNIRQITARGDDDGEINEGSVAVSPDGRLITFTTELYNASMRYRYLRTYVVAADGSGPGAPLAVSASSGAAPVFSRDGRRMAFYGISGQRSYGNETVKIYVYDVEKGEARSVADVIRDFREESGPMLDWSPDGSRIAYTDLGDGDNSAISPLEIRVAASDGSGSVRTIARSAACPVWSPDGRRIYYCGGGYGWKLVAMNADGSGVPDTLRSEDPRLELFPQVSPDGKNLVYTAHTGDPEKTPGAISVLDLADPSRATTITTSGHRGFWIRTTP